MSKAYETVIGLEVHVELATKTKIFCGCSTAFGGAPNTHTCPVCTGMPGSLPVLNKEVVNKAIAVGLATNCTITQNCKFDRKNYFYPDNPQNYQISQLYYPICRDGKVEIEVEGKKKWIGIHEIHMEEDAGKLIHDPSTNSSLVDYNRSGVPLIEIVSEPDMRSAEEVIAYLDKLRTTIQYLGASDCKLNEGSMRADVNLSIREVGATEYGTRTEMKNLNSFKAIARAIENERARQIDLLESGQEVVQETRRWDDTKGYSYAMRSKEDAQDYRYFPDPDLVPIIISAILAVIFQNWLSTVITAILTIIFGLALIMGQCRLAKTEDLGFALAIGDAIGDISRIGILKLLVFIILVFIIYFIIFFILGAISQWNATVGGILMGILGVYLTFFTGRATGLLYSDV